MKKLLLMLLLSGVSVQALEAAARADQDTTTSAVTQEMQEDLNNQCIISLLLTQAAARDNATEAERLISAGAQVNAQLWPLRQTPLHYAASTGAIECVKLFLREGALVNKQDLEGFTPLLTAIVKRKPKVVELLLNAGALPDLPCYKGITALGYAVATGMMEFVEILLEAGAWVDAPARGEFTALGLALLVGNLKMARMLLEHGADPNIDVPQADTTLFGLLVSQEFTNQPRSNNELIRLMLEFGADPNVVRNRGEYTFTPLILAIENGNNPGVQAMLESGAKITPAVEAAAAASPNKLIRRFIENRKRADAAAESKRDDQETKTIEEVAAAIFGIDLESTSAKKSNKNTQAKSGKKKQTQKQQSKAAGAPVPDEVAATEPTPESPRSDEEDGVAYLEMLEPAPTPAAGAAAGSADEEECPRASLYLSRAGVIDFNFLPAGGEEAGNAIAFGPATKHVMHKLCAFDSEEERGLTSFSEKRFDTAGGLLLVAPHIQDKFASLLRTRDGALDQDVVDHLVSTELMLKALRYGSCYLAVDTTAWVAKPYLLVVAPIERTLSAGLSEFAFSAKNYLTLCFSIDYKGSINHCYHFCVQNKHPKQTKTEAGTAKYKLKPIAAKAKIRKRGAHYKLKLEFARAEDFRNGVQELRGA